MKLPILKKLAQEDFPSEVSDWIEKIIYPYNQLVQALIATLDKNITVGDNFGQIYEATIVSRVSPSPYPIKFKNNLNRKPVGLLVIAANEVGSNETPPGPLTATWKINEQGLVQVDTVTGLTTTPETNYKLTFLLF